MLENNLESLGLTKNEITVYLVLVEKKKLKAGEVIKITKLHRNLVYQALEKLEQRGLVSKMIQNSIFVFEANHPSHLLESLDQQRIIAQEVIDELKKREAGGHRNIRVYDGIEGILQARRQSLELKSGETLYALGVFPVSSGLEYNKEWERFHQERVKKEINFRVLYDRKTSSEHLSLRNTQALTQARYLPSNVKSPVRFEMYGDVVSIVLPKSGPVTFSLKSKEAAEGLREYFEYLWNQEVVVENGVEAIGNAFYEMLADLEKEEEYCVIGASDTFQQIMSSSFFTAYHTLRVAKGVRVRMLTRADSLDLVRENSIRAGDTEGRLSEFRVMKTGQSLPIQINLYGKKTLLIIYGKNPCVMRFDRSDVHDLFQNYFNELWNQKTQTLNGFDGIRQLCQKVIDEKKDLYLIAANGHLLRDHKEFYEEFTSQRVQHSISLHAFAIESVRGTPFASLPRAHFKYLSEDFGSPMVVWIFGETVAHVLFQKPEIVFLITDSTVASYYRNYFKALQDLASE